MLTPAHVDLYCRIKSSPFALAGFRVDAALIFCEQVERRLEKLDAIQRNALILQGIGYTQSEIALLNGVSLRSMVRRIGEANKVIFAELIEVQGAPAKMKGATRFGRRGKKAA